ncbi:hypothetical protein, partial [Streptomyces prasinus]|uniref:hypothetical protein n=1 Tax=Streptomyces prasinus TaxID=67345 RepID=UPI0006EB9BCC
TPDTAGPGPEQAPASPMPLRHVRGQLAGRETDLIETARGADAGWADPAGPPDTACPPGTADRRAAERRYLRGRPGAVGTTGEQRVTATRRDGAAERANATRARAHATDPHRPAGQITALGRLAPEARSARTAPHAAPGAAGLLAPPACTRPTSMPATPVASIPRTPTKTGARRQPLTMPDSPHRESPHAGAVRPAPNHADDGQRSVPARVQVRP